MIPIRDDIPSQRVPVCTVLLIVVNVGAFLYQSMLPEEQQERLVFRYGFTPARIAQLRGGEPTVTVISEGIDPRRGGGRIYVFLRPGARDYALRVPQLGIVAPLEGRPHAQVVSYADRAVGRWDITVFPLTWSGALLSALTSMFLHGGLLHLLGNMWYLWLFGDNVEDRLGHGRFVLFYLLTGLLAAVIHLFANPTSAVPTVGASGAIAGVLGGYAISFPYARIIVLLPLFWLWPLVELPAMVVLGFWFVIQFLSGTASLYTIADGGGGVAWWAHIGGFVAGFALMKLFQPEIPGRRGPTWTERYG